MPRNPARPFLALALLLAVLAGTVGCRAAPLLDAAAGWSSTDALTGPRIQVGLGEYQATDPFTGNSPCPGGICTPPAPDPALVDGLKAVEAQAAAAKAQVDALDAKVAAGTLTQAQADSIRDATAKADAAAQAAREATARATAAQADATAAANKVPPPPSIPTDWTPTGILGALVGAGLWFVRRRAAQAAQAQADRAKAEALAAQKAALDAYDAAPYTPADVASIKAAEIGATPRPTS